MNKTILYLDMDNVLVDFKSGLARVSDEVKSQYECDENGKQHYDDIPGLFGLMDPVEGAVEAVGKLKEKYDLYILSTAPWNNPSAWSDKLLWVKRYFGDTFHKRLILTHHKNLCLQSGAYLVDDRHRHGANQFGDHWIQLGSDRFPDWDSVVKFLLHDSAASSGLEEARALAMRAHKDQVDKAGAPYFSHPERVANRCQTDDEKIVAYLHDTIEDTFVSEELLEEMGFPQAIVEAVLAVTRKDGESYEDFVARAKKNPIGRQVKIHDLEDNMDITRLPDLNDEDSLRLKKYLKAYHYLKS